MAPESLTRKRTRNQSNRSTQNNPEDQGKPPNLTEQDNISDHQPSQPPTDEEDLRRAIKIASNSVSSSYTSYEVPVLSDQKDKFGRRMIAYPCKFNLNKHASICLRKSQESKSEVSLSQYGFSGGGEINPKEVPQLCAMWCAEAARPFSALFDPSLKAILHPTVVKHLPKYKDVSKDIHLLYSAIQSNYGDELKAHHGALYLGVDVSACYYGRDNLS
ncbi:hypothetical protein PGT21_008102 [Puccinia graminis f. sp. tritici]|uniref:Uncharacterized protein n=1 Tax=Puccinia graminis f. sp. tritici TaxID=56615 RepID=A0A5B0MWL0_PUCGR|nr:hypothetical protein PGT21_008102 [Puccinia graminis f. sp. tritici]